jgi:hypothetical protein
MPGPKLKPVSRKDDHQFLRGLECFSEFRKRVVAGWTTGALVDYLLEEEPQVAKHPRPLIAGRVDEFRKSIPPGEFVSDLPEGVVNQRLMPLHTKVAQQLHQGLDELSELEKLYRIQLKRIEKGVQLEDEKNKLSPTMVQEMRVAKEILETSAQLKMDLGISKRHLGLVEMEGRLMDDIGARYGSEAVSRVLEDPEKRQRIASVAQRLLVSDGSISASVLEKFLTLNKDTDAPVPVSAEGATGQKLMAKVTSEEPT